MKSIAVFCGSGSGNDPVYLKTASAIGRLLAENGIQLVYGGAAIGCMGAVADAALAAGGQVTGIIPRFIQDHEIAHTGLTELITVESMHERKLQMYEKCDAAIALPGGFGTMDELFEMLTWQQLNLHHKPIGLLNLENYYEHLILLMKQMETGGLLRTKDRLRLLIDHDVEALLKTLLQQISTKDSGKQLRDKA